MVQAPSRPNDVLDPDLVYNGRTRKRPPGASPCVRAIYTLLVAHPEGMTVSAIHDAMRETWRATDAYRAYDQYLKRQRLISLAKTTAKEIRKSRIPEYETVVFKERARHWWIQTRLTNMKDSKTARREGTGKRAVWFAGERTPREILNCPVDIHLRPMNIQAEQRRADDQVRREKVKAALFAALDTPRLQGKAVRLAYNYLCGRG